MSQTRDRDLALVPLSPRAPAPFDGYDQVIWDRAYELWSSIAGRSGARVARLLAQEFGEGTRLPVPATINARAIAECWAAQADADLENSHGRQLYELRVGWLSALKLAQTTLQDGMAGLLDGLPYGGAGRIKSAEITLRVIERAGLLAVLPTPEAQADDLATTEALSLEEREARLRQHLQARKKAG